MRFLRESHTYIHTSSFAHSPLILVLWKVTKITRPNGNMREMILKFENDFLCKVMVGRVQELTMPVRTHKSISELFWLRPIFFPSSFRIDFDPGKKQICCKERNLLEGRGCKWSVLSSICIIISKFDSMHWNDMHVALINSFTHPNTIHMKRMFVHQGVTRTEFLLKFSLKRMCSMVNVKYEY